MSNIMFGRRPNTTREGNSFSESTKRAVWNKATIVRGCDPNVLRKDRCNAWIQYNEYGNRNSQYGWEIDHDFPVSKGGEDELYNLQPLQWKNNAHKGDTIGGWYCVVAAAA